MARKSSPKLPRSTLRREQVLEHLHYTPETGVFRWVKSRWASLIGKEAGTISGPHFYRQIGIGNTIIPAHRLAWLIVHGEWPQGQIDHINGDRLDNRIENLRDVTQEQNAYNRVLYKNNSSGIKGVYWNSALQKWHSQIRVSGKRVHLGFFTTKQDAADAYAAGSRRYHGEFGRTAMAA